ncbi:MAG TPA: hypothetical protein VHY22_03350 [Chthoniobacteraceae bacterium]|jgi:hypothetical protein|nr:hypothetical protein [Chthoniobacteraceae bacterium]
MMTRFLIAAGLAATLIAAAPLRAATDVNDTARFLAGMPVDGNSPLAPLTQDPAWRQHSAYFDSAWTKLDTRQLSRIRAFTGQYVRARAGNLFYMFSGPDFLYANAFFPDERNYVLCGIEPVGAVPDVTKLSLGPAFYQVETALNSVLNYSFFQTKQMRQDFSSTQLNGTLPILMVFLARSGKTIENISPVQPRGVRIDFNGGSLYYFSVDLSNGSVERSGLLSFCRRLGRADSLLKSASYLPHQDGFSTICNFLLNQSDTIVEDDSGIPYHDFNPAQWQVRLFGSYQPPIDIFKQYFQPDLAGAYARSNPAPLTFGIGYRGWDFRKSALIVAHRR